MTTFKYEAISKSGMPVSGIIDAHDRNDAVIRLNETCSSVTKLTEVKSAILAKKLSNKKVNEKKLALVCKQFSIILTAGIPLVKCVELVAGQTEDSVLKNILVQVSSDVSAGYGLADSLERRGPSLPTTFVETIRAGEESGSLETAFERMSDYFSKKTKVRAKIVSALTYPAFVVAVAIFVIIIVMVKAVPVFSASFESMGIELPGVTRALISMSNFFKNYFVLILVVIAVVVAALTIWGKTERGRYKLDKFKLDFPVTGKIQLMNAASQFANTLSTMLASGLPFVRALNITAKSMTNYYMARAVADTAEGVESGYHIGDCMRNTDKFPDLLVEMTTVGEKSGSMEHTLSVIGEYYDNEIETATSRAVSLLEPIIICILAVFVVFILLAVYIPMFSMYGDI